MLSELGAAINSSPMGGGRMAFGGTPAPGHQRGADRPGRHRYVPVAPGWRAPTGNASAIASPNVIGRDTVVVDVDRIVKMRRAGREQHEGSREGDQAAQDQARTYVSSGR